MLTSPPGAVSSTSSVERIVDDLVRVVALELDLRTTPDRTVSADAIMGAAAKPATIAAIAVFWNFMRCVSNRKVTLSNGLTVVCVSAQQL